jgi:hypothetical protein
MSNLVSLRVLLATPTYGPVDPHCASALRAAVMTAARHGVEWMGDLSPDRMKYTDARNFCVDVLASEPTLADGIMWVDSDMDPAPDSILRLLHSATVLSADFYSGVYHQRAGDYRPVFYGHVGDDKYKQCEIYEPDKITKEGACGFGFVWTSTKLLKAIEALPEFDRDQGGWFPDHRYSGTSEDLGFGTLARHAGFQLYVDTGIQVGHMGVVQFVTREDSIRALAKGKEPSRVVMG